jgi:phosphotriesterase-related protein
MRKIPTVLGEIEDSVLGVTLFHEHVACVNPSFYNAFSEKWFQREKVIERAVKLFKQAKEECGVSTIIDGTPIDLGRDIEMIKEVSLRSGVNILVSSGIYYSEEAFLYGKKAENLAKFFIEERQTGIENTNVRPALLKCATGRLGVTEINEILLTAMAITQKETGLPLYCHNEHEVKTAYAQLSVFEKHGVDMSKVVIGHCSDCYDINYLTDLLKNGCYLGFDRIYPSVYEKQAETISELIAKGYEDKLLVSHDYAAFLDFGDTYFEIQELDNRDFTTVHKKLFPALKGMGITNNQMQKLAVDNPRKVLSGECS